jgi:hypothetical protein
MKMDKHTYLEYCLEIYKCATQVSKPEVDPARSQTLKKLIYDEAQLHYFHEMEP